MGRANGGRKLRKTLVLKINASVISSKESTKRIRRTVMASSSGLAETCTEVNLLMINAKGMERCNGSTATYTKATGSTVCKMGWESWSSPMASRNSVFSKTMSSSQTLTTMIMCLNSSIVSALMRSQSNLLKK